MFETGECSTLCASWRATHLHNQPPFFALLGHDNPSAQSTTHRKWLHTVSNAAAARSQPAMPRAGPALPALLLLALLTAAATNPTVNHALQLRSSPVVLLDAKGLDTNEFTVEAWISTPIDCTRAGILSYALNSSSDDPAIRAAAYNHFVVFDATNVIACHGVTLHSYQPRCHTNLHRPPLHRSLPRPPRPELLLGLQPKHDRLGDRSPRRLAPPRSHLAGTQAGTDARLHRWHVARGGLDRWV